MIKESLYLPSQGIPYKGKLDGASITVTPITTRVYKDFLMSGVEEGILNLIDACLVDSPIKAEDFVFQDELAILIKIRSISLGSVIPVYSVCPSCQTRNKENWDIMSMECRYLSIENYPFEVTLPETQQKIGILLPTSRLNRFAKEEAQKRASRFDKKVSEFLPSFQAAVTLEVKGKSDLTDRADWYSSLPLKDAIYIDQVLTRLQDFGLNITKQTTCSCNRTYYVPLSVTQDFFRPDIRDIEGIKTTEGTLEKGPQNSVKA